MVVSFKPVSSHSKRFQMLIPFIISTLVNIALVAYIAIITAAHSKEKAKIVSIYESDDYETEYDYNSKGL